MPISMISYTKATIILFVGLHHFQDFQSAAIGKKIKIKIERPIGRQKIWLNASI